MAAEHRDAGFLDPVVVDLLGDKGLEAPESRVLGAIGRDPIEGAVAVLLQADASVEFACQSTDRRAVADLLLVVDVRAA